ncbi:hypothetical protein, partial [Simplicispira metamorpha]
KGAAVFWEGFCQICRLIQVVLFLVNSQLHWLSFAEKTLGFSLVSLVSTAILITGEKSPRFIGN